MPRQRAGELTHRELDVLRVFWRLGESTILEVRDELASDGLDLYDTTVAAWIRMLRDKGYLERTTDSRPFHFEPTESYEVVSDRMLDDVIDRFFNGSRQQLLARVLGRKKLTSAERATLDAFLS